MGLASEPASLNGGAATALRILLMAVWAIALPVFLVATNVRWVTLDLSTYTTGFARYRAAGGPRTSLLPDFFIGAHAHMARLPLLTRDTRRYRTYFPEIELIAPGT